jgi:type I restriction enzyme S subunit
MSIDMEEFERVKIGSICDKVCSGGTPKSTISEYYDGNIPWLNTKEVDFNRIDKTERCITELGLNNSSAKWIAANCVIVAMYGATAGKVAISTIPLTTNQACCNLQINPNKADYRYVYYFIKSRYQHLASLANGGAQQNLNAQQIKDFEILLPSLDAQKRIADILWELDSKIELNRKINENLEQQAQAIFKSWFIDFEPFKDGKFVETELGMIPEGWKVNSLTDIADFQNGLAMQKYPPLSDDDSIPVLKIKELGQSYCDSNSDRCTKNLKPEFIVHDGDVVFSWSGTLLVDLWCGGICGLNQHLFKVTSSQYSKWFYLMWTKHHLAEFIRIAKDKAVTMGHIKRGDLDKAFVLIPDDSTFERISPLMNVIIDKIISLRLESARLATLRDTLLPKLMSGQITL